MDSIRVQGGIPLRGKVRIQGSKNAALPVMASALLTREKVVLENVPKISDVYGMVRILEMLGCRASWMTNALLIDPAGASQREVEGELATSMRSSVFLLGAMLARENEACLEDPGGCVIGKRPIDLHVKALQKMGVTFTRQGSRLKAVAEHGIMPAQIDLDFPSVGATENILMAATAAEGVTTITGAAREPEVQALCRFLQALGAQIRGIGTSCLTVMGGRGLSGGRFLIPPDRIVAGTYLLAGFVTGGAIFLEDVPCPDMEAVFRLAERMGAAITLTNEGIYVQYPEKSNVLPMLKTEVYPGFPTDLQSVLLAVRCTGRGDTLIRETIFENRFRICEELRRMGARIRNAGDDGVLVTGIKKLKGAEVEAYELRGGAGLVVAALGAEGKTVIRGRRFIDRGYENICRDLRELGARIVSE